MTRLEPERSGSRRWVVELDGDAWRRMPRAAVKKLGLEPDDEVSRERLGEQLSRIEPELARERALYLLSGRERSHHEILRKLADDGFDEGVASDVADDLVRTGLLDDERFAEVLTRSLAAGRGYGRARVSRELDRRGVPADAALAALDATCPAQDELGRAVEAARLMTRGRHLEMRKLAGRLARRGFAPGVALEAARSVAQNEQERD